jgi:hypothetical protein
LREKNLQNKCQKKLAMLKNKVRRFLKTTTMMRRILVDNQLLRSEDACLHSFSCEK